VQLENKNTANFNDMKHPEKHSNSELGPAYEIDKMRVTSRACYSSSDTYS
jgi:hypothetical protein